jgi:integrase
MTFEARLSQANGRLKAGKIGVSIEVRGERLCLRAVLPPRPGSSKKQPYQQRLALHCHANPSGLKLAEQEARKVGAMLESKTFDWVLYVKPIAMPSTCADWVARFEADYFSRRARTPKTETTWRHDYQKVFTELPSDTPLSLEVLDSLIRSKPPDTRTRKRFVDVCTRLASFAGLKPDFAGLKGSYSAAKVVPRDLPGDLEVAHYRSTIPNLEWRRVYGLLAVYGLRPHEAFSCDLSRFPLVQVAAETKTGARLVYPFYPEWAESWELKGALPLVSGKTNSDVGNRVTHAFKRYSIPFPPYHLRHCWAVRSLQFGLDVSLAAAQMGHSVKVHCEIYHAWITEDIHDQAYRTLMGNPSRPKPPGLEFGLKKSPD